MKNHLIAIAFCAMSIACPLAAQVQGAWSAAGALSSAVELNAQVLLGNGQILVAGGTDGTNYFSSAQLYNPTTGTWKPTGSMATGRDNFAAVVLNNGKVLVEGGLGSGAAILATAELYDPSTGKWSSAGAMSAARYFHTATLLQNGEVLVTGGCSSSYCSSITAVSEIYNPATNRWTTVSSLNQARYDHTASLLKNGEVLVVGGLTSAVTKTCELYNPSTKAWTTAASTSVPRYQHGATLLSSGKVLVSGGRCGNGCVYNSAEIYDPATKGWTATESMKTGRALHSVIALANNTVLVAGGGVPGCFRSSCLNSTNTAEIYDVASGNFSKTVSLNQTRMYQTASLLKSGQVILVGGIGGSGSAGYKVLSSAEVYTPLTLTFSAANLTFGLKQRGFATPSQSVTVTNVSRSSVTFTPFTGIASSGDFAQTNTCPVKPATTLAAGQSCVINVTFKPTAAGNRTGAVTLKDNSLGNPTQTITLTGTGEQYAIGVTPTSLSLPSVSPGYTSAPLSATVTNAGAVKVNIKKIDVSPANGTTFTQTNNCPASLNPNQTCTVQIVFTPPDSVTFNANLQIFDDALGSPHLLPLTGTGTD